MLRTKTTLRDLQHAFVANDCHYPTPLDHELFERATAEGFGMVGYLRARRCADAGAPAVGRCSEVRRVSPQIEWFKVFAAAYLRWAFSNFDRIVADAAKRERP